MNEASKPPTDAAKPLPGWEQKPQVRASALAAVASRLAEVENSRELDAEEQARRWKEHAADHLAQKAVQDSLCEEAEELKRQLRDSHRELQQIRQRLGDPRPATSTQVGCLEAHIERLRKERDAAWGAYRAAAKERDEATRPAEAATVEVAQDDEQAIEDVMAAIKRDDPTGFASMRIVKAIIDEMRDTHNNALEMLLAQEGEKAKKLAAQRDEALAKLAGYSIVQGGSLRCEVKKLRSKVKRQAHEIKRLRSQPNWDTENQRLEAANSQLIRERDEARDERDSALGTLRELSDAVGTAHNLALQKVAPAPTDDEPPF